MGTAIISPCEKYRYVLTREIPQLVRWVKPCLFIMLNPSTADHRYDDPTIKKCLYFAERELCTSLTVVNLFAYRSTNPDDLLKVTKPVGDENVKYLNQQIDKHELGLIIAAWGNHKMAQRAELLPVGDTTPNMWCLGKNKNGSPKHPLYLPHVTKLERFP